MRTQAGEVEAIQEPNRREPDPQADTLLRQANQIQRELQTAFVVWIGIAFVYFIGAVCPSKIGSSALTFTYILFGIYWPTFFIYLCIRFW